MGDKSKIEWTDATWNPWWGCQKVGPGCDHCYAEGVDKRAGGGHWGPGAERRRTSDSNWNEPLRWQRKADQFESEHGHRRRVFCGSMMDIMDNAVPAEWARDAFARMEECDRLDWLLLTKRVGNVAGRVLARWTKGLWPRNVGLMITVVDQKEADRDIPKLLALKAEFGIPWVGLSMEPLLGPVDLTSHLWRKETACPECTQDADCFCGFYPRAEILGEAGLDWIIAGGESGGGARPAHPDWYRNLRDQCFAAGTPFFFKQWGEWKEAAHEEDGPYIRDVEIGTEEAAAFKGAAAKPGFVSLDGTFYRHERYIPEGGSARLMDRVGKERAGRLLDGVEHNGMPGVLS